MTAPAPAPKVLVLRRADRDVVDFFRADGPGHLSRMHAVLRASVDAARAAQ
ncbi:BrnA antitoxin family protein [Oceaniglobus ichthyenteri]|uniref:BrnA antitoxin family protein n=1 Tax=Oceaniglobus ichthyenteri TaxID=2136177 RepID=UPI003B835969